LKQAALCIRADATSEIGTGHIMRCLALAQAWREAGGEAVLATALSPGGLEDRLVAEGLPIHRLRAEAGSDVDARATAALARDLGADWAVVDGYHFMGEYQRLLKDAGMRVLVVDDNGHAEHYWADAVLNQNLHARETLYPSREPDVRMLLGPRYALLRREFWKWRGWRHSHPEEATKVLVTFGGSDPANVTLKAVGALARLSTANLEVAVIVGASNPNLPALQSTVSTASQPKRLLTDVRDMAELMAWADIVVAAGGTTSWELAFMGLPALTIVLADNQVDLAESLAAHGVVRNLGWHTRLTEARLADASAELMKDQAARRIMGARGRELVDGDGGRRVVRTLVEADSRAELAARPDQS
jgi:UDP-2,4-diacetamido-2,4,6-trideoxy-beta-L-altropyranose hydrolase